MAARAAAESSAYEARVTTPRAQVRSGPGEKFYPTATLAQGDTVEVYREEAGGWLAIRPPKDSFSWVDGRHLILRDGGLAEILKDNVASRIGSRLSDKRNAAQVRLKKGEVVEIIGEQQVGSESWYKIAPPAGEFRWIHATSVERVRPLSTPDNQTDAAPPVVAASATNKTSAGAADTTATEAPAPLNDAKAAPGDQWRAPDPSSNTQSSEIVPPPLAAPSVGAAPASATPPIANALVPKPTTDDLARQLTDIEMRLSRMAAAPPNLWNTQRLERDAEQLLAQAQTAAERDAVKVTLGKIDQFTALTRRYQQGAPNVAAAGQALVVAGSPDRATQLTGGLTAGAGSGDPRTSGGDPRTTAGGSPADAGRYDAVGILRPVVSKRPGAPQFALVDERGQVVTFVTPSPDVNLQTYLGRRVGIAGNRGFIPEFNRAHVTAGRVTPLSERFVR